MSPRSGTPIPGPTGGANLVGRTTDDCTGESALVTGSTPGIGRGIARPLTAADADVVVNSRTESDGEETAVDLDELGSGTVIGITADLPDATDIEELLAGELDAFGTVALLVNNAAIWPMAESMLEADLTETWQVRLVTRVAGEVSERMG